MLFQKVFNPIGAKGSSSSVYSTIKIAPLDLLDMVHSGIESSQLPDQHDTRALQIKYSDETWNFKLTDDKTVMEKVPGSVLASLQLKKKK